MSKTKKQKLFLSAVSVSVAAGALATIVPEVSAQERMFTDVKAEDHFYNAVDSLHGRGIIKGYDDKTFRPYTSLTRAQAAKIIAMALNVTTKNVKDPGFKDVPKTDWAYEYVAALANAGIITGYGDQFKPNEPLTRAQMAKIIALSFKLESGTLEKSPFNDVKPSDWFAEYMKPLLEKEITTGTTPTTFSPNKPVLRGQMASFIYRSEHATKGIQVTTDLTNITNQEIVTKAGTYALPEDLKAWLNPANLPALKGAEVSLAVKDGKVEKVESIELTANGSLSSDTNNPYANHVVFDGKGATISANIIVNADYVTLKNAMIKGDLHLGKGIENSFYSDGVKAEGKTVVADEVKASAQQPSKFYKSLANKQYISKFQAAVTADNKVTIVFNNTNLGSVQVSKSGVEFESTGSSAVGSVSLSGDVTFKAANSVVIPKIVIAAGVQNVVIDSDVAEIVVEGNQSVTITGSGNFDKVVAGGSSTVSVQTTGKVGTLQIADKKSKFVLAPHTKVANLVLPEGVKPQDAISNYDSVKGNVDQIGGVKNPDVPPPATGGGGSAPDRTAPTVTAMNQSIASEADVEITSTETGAIYLVPDGATPVSKDDLDDLVNGGTAKTSIISSANTSVTISTTGLTIGAYKLYAVDRSGNVSQPVSISITKHPAVLAVETAIGQLKNVNDFTFNDRSAFFSAEYSHYVLTDNQKAQVDSAVITKLTDLKTLITGWERAGSGADVTDTKVSYDQTTGQLVLNVNDASKVAAVDFGRMKVNYGTANVTSIELAGAYVVDGNKIIISLTNDKKTEVNNLITSAGGVGNTWIHLGAGSLLDNKQVPAKLTKVDIPLERVPTTTGTLHVSATKVQENGTVDVTVTDDDLNKKADVAETVNVTVGNAILQLTETGDSTGVFTGTTAGLFPVGQIVITYTDDFDVHGNQAKVTKTITVTPQQN